MVTEQWVREFVISFYVGVFIEFALDCISIYAIFRPFSGILKFLNKINWTKMVVGFLLGNFAVYHGYPHWESLLVGFGPVTTLYHLIILNAANADGFLG